MLEPPRRLIALALLACARNAVADPTEPPPPAAPVTAPDGAARNLEQQPEPEHVRGLFVFDWLGTGASYLVRAVFAPARGVLYLQARYDLVTKIRDVFVNDAGTLGVYPDGSYESTFGLSYGARAFAKNLFDHDEELSLSAKTGGAYRAAAQLKFEADELAGAPIYVKARARYEDNLNAYFAGIGNGPHLEGMELAATASDVATRFSQKRFLGALSTGAVMGPIKLGGSLIFNKRTFGTSGDGASDPSVEQVYDTSTLRGFDTGFSNLELTADAELDTRDTRGPTESGTRVRAFFGGGSLVQSARYAHYGAEAAYYLTPGWHRRTLIFRAVLEGVIDRDDDIPFTELPRLGGAYFLRGYHTDQFRDKIAGAGTVEYHYPIHNNVSGAFFIEAGKVSRTYDELLGAGRGRDWHIGYGGGLLFHTRKSIVIRTDLAYGDGLNFYLSTDVLDAFRNREREL
ncbi:MAG: hypothetical protein ABI678_03590 [Kofleriaceae bacterium]